MRKPKSWTSYRLRTARSDSKAKKCSICGGWILQNEKYYDKNGRYGAHHKCVHDPQTGAPDLVDMTSSVDVLSTVINAYGLKTPETESMPAGSEPTENPGFEEMSPGVPDNWIKEPSPEIKRTISKTLPVTAKNEKATIPRTPRFSSRTRFIQDEDLEGLSEDAQKIIRIADLMDSTFRDSCSETHLVLCIMAGLSDAYNKGFEAGSEIEKARGNEDGSE